MSERCENPRCQKKLDGNGVYIASLKALYCKDCATMVQLSPAEQAIKEFWRQHPDALAETPCGHVCFLPERCRLPYPCVWRDMAWREQLEAMAEKLKDRMGV